MVRSLAMVAGLGFAGLFVAKILWAFLLPLFGMLLGLLVTVAKLGLIAALIWFGYQLYRRFTERPAEG